MPKIERKYLAHYIDASFGGEQPNYIRLGKDLEEYNEELNPDVEITKNILGEQNVNHNGYEVQSEVDPFYAYSDDPLLSVWLRLPTSVLPATSALPLRLTCCLPLTALLCGPTVKRCG